jgi:hypothetical protein
LNKKKKYKLGNRDKKNAKKEQNHRK